MPAHSALTAAECERLTRLLGLLGSDHDGEVLNAARLADRFIRERGMTWPAVIVHQLALPSPPPAPDLLRAMLRDWPERWRAAVHLRQRAAGSLAPKDRGFVTAITGYAHQPSAPQLVSLRNMVERLLERVS